MVLESNLMAEDISRMIVKGENYMVDHLKLKKIPIEEDVDLKI